MGIYRIIIIYLNMQNNTKSLTSNSTLVKKFPIGKCLNIANIQKFIEDKYKIDFTNLKPETPTKNKYHDFNFFDFIEEKCKERPFPLVTPASLDKLNPHRYKGYI